MAYDVKGSELAQAYPVSWQRLPLLLRCAGSMPWPRYIARRPPVFSGVDAGWYTQVEFHRRVRFDVVVALAAVDSYPVGKGW